MKDQIKKLREGISNDAAQIAFHMQTVLGFPFDSFEKKFNSLNFIQQVSFCMKYKKYHNLSEN